MKQKQQFLKKILKLVFSVALVTVALNANAQVDVTATYLVNANFNDSCNYLTDATGNLGTSNTGTASENITGWTNGYPGNSTWAATSTFEYGTAITLNTITVPAADPNANFGSGQGALGVSVAWGGSTTYYKNATLPAGNYSIIYKYYNGRTGVTGGSSLVGWVPDAGSPTLSSVTSFTDGAWTTDQVDFLVPTDASGKIQIGVKAINSGSGSNAVVFFDDVVIMYTAPTQSLDASLSSLTASVGTLSPAFDPNIFNYSLKVPAATSSVDLTATVNDPNAFAFGDGTIPLSGDISVDIVVTAEAGNSQTYTVRISENYLFNQTFDNNPNYFVADTGNLAPANNGSANLAVYGWDLNRFEYSTSATFEYGTAVTMGEVADSKAVPATDADGGTTGAALGIMASWSADIRYSQHITLAAGTYKISYKAYNANAAGAVGNSLVGWVPDSGNATLSTLSNGFTSNTWVADEVIFSVPSDASGKIQVGMKSPTNSSPTDKAHVFFDHFNLVKLAASADASLSSLTTSVGTLSPAFVSSTFLYKLQVPSGTTSLDLSAIKNDAGASVLGDGTITLNGNDQIVDIIVTAELGNTQTYKVLIYDDYLFNETFDNGIHFDLSASGNLGTANGGVNVLEAPGWTKHYGDNCVGATFEYGTLKTMNGATPPSVDADGSSVGASYGIQAAWGSSAYYTQPVTLPAGSYKISYKMYNASATISDIQSLVGFVPDTGTATMSTLTSVAVGTWAADEVTFSLGAETTGVIQLGHKAPNAGSGSQPRLFFDHFELTQTALSVDEFEVNAFKYGPNPAKDLVNLTSKVNISEVSFYNIVGQHELTFKNLSAKASLDISKLSIGMHFMKVQIQDQVKVIKLMVK